MENEQDGTPTLKETEVTETEETTEESEQVDWEAKAKKAEELAENYKKRAEKAEKKVKEGPKQDTSSFNANDFLYLAKVDIHEEDLAELNNVMAKMGMTAREAHEYLKPRFAIKNEERMTAQATATTSGRGKKIKTGEDYLAEAEKTGEIPKDDRSMQEMIIARQKAKFGWR